MAGWPEPGPGMNRFHVAAGILRDAGGRVLITERSEDGPFKGLWEFPGGKIEPGETPETVKYHNAKDALGISRCTSNYLRRKRI